MKWLKKAVVAALAVALCATSVITLAACNKKEDDSNLYTYNTYTITMPANWNKLTSVDNNDSQIMNYLSSSFFTYDYKFDEAKGGKFTADGKVNADAIVEDAFIVQYEAATALDDVTATYAEKYGFTADQVQEGGYAWKITLRHDLQWDDGTPIDASDFVYTMEQQLDPKFMNARASEYYKNQIKLINAQNYVFQGQSGKFAAHDIYNEFTDELAGELIFTLGNAAENQTVYSFNGVINMRSAMGFPESYTAELCATYLVQQGINNKVDATVEQILALQGKTYAQIKADATLKATFDKVVGCWKTVPNEELDFFIADYTYPELSFDKVGIFNPTQYELVIAMTQPLLGLKNSKGELTYNAAYALESLPLVKKSLYESCKIAPGATSTLWTSNYGTSLATSASWGAYKLTQYQSGKSYTLDRNDKWFGYTLDENKDQYLIDRISCEQIADLNTRWMGFLDGSLASIGIDVNHQEYARSKYAVYSPRIAMFSFNLYADLDTLKENDSNNGILAIKEFRKAISLSLDRAAYNSKLSVANQPCYGLLDNAYYYDIEHSTELETGGIYRNTDQAKKAILRAYGYTEEEDGTWSNGGAVDHWTLERAYESVNGYDLTQAKKLVDEAYDILMADTATYGYDPSKDIVITMGASENDDLTQLEYQTVQDVFATMLKGTKLEGKVKIELNATLGDQWGEEFQAGNYELCTGGYGNAPFDPFYMISSYIEPSFALTNFWDVETAMMTFTMPAGDYAGAGQTFTASVMNWQRCLTGSASDNDTLKYNWGAGAVDASVRLELLAKLEEEILTQYYSIPYASGQTAAMLSAKFSYINYNYNTMLSFGGMRYMRVNYNNGEWRKFVSENGGDLSDVYKQN